MDWGSKLQGCGKEDRKGGQTRAWHRTANTPSEFNKRRNQPLPLIVQQAVPHPPDHDLLLGADGQLDLNAIDGVSDRYRLDSPGLCDAGVAYSLAKQRDYLLLPGRQLGHSHFLLRLPKRDPGIPVQRHVSNPPAGIPKV